MRTQTAIVSAASSAIFPGPLPPQPAAAAATTAAAATPHSPF